MTQTDDLISLHSNTCKDAADLLIRKNHDYTGGTNDALANFRISEVIGVKPELAILIRVMDKIKRLATFCGTGNLKVNESAEDSIIDIINYMVILKAFLKENNQIATRSDTGKRQGA